MFNGYYAGKRVWLTGHTDFKGSWLGLWLKQLGATVGGYSLPAPTQPSLFELVGSTAFSDHTEADVRDLPALEQSLRRFQPDLIFHLAAQPLVRASYSEPLETLHINALGTANMLEAVRRAESPANVIIVTTDKCYENRGWDYGYRECDPLGGHDVYSMSKAAAELITSSWRRSFFAANPKLGHVATVRAGNVIGGGDYAPSRIVPDCIRALAEGKLVTIRNPQSTRPWQHVLDCLSGYLCLGAQLANEPKGSPLADAFNFGPGTQANRTVGELVSELLRTWPGEWRHVPSPNAPHEAEKLNLAIDKAAAQLGWHPTWNFEEAVLHTATWYFERHQHRKANMVEFSLRQIERFSQCARAKRLAWAAAPSA
jgi:CDP-glucose 4,6-dehydratase